MIDLKNVLDILNKNFVLPIAIITFLLLIYIALYLRTKDADIVRSRIFLKYGEFKNSFITLAIFAFLLVLHVSFIYIPVFFSFYDPMMNDLQHLFGISLALSLIAFVGTIYRTIR
ncbi:MAG TPA: hypothetical protein VIO11_04360 [Candidatus Methanoperedens sp.]